MTTTTTTDDAREGDTTPPAQHAAAGTDAHEDAHDPAVTQDEPDTPEGVRQARREAQALRRRLKDAETERERLAGVVAGFQRASVEQLAEAGPRALASGADLWAAGADLAALLDDEGRPDPAKVTAAVDLALQRRPHWRKSYGSADNGARGTSPEPSASWGDLVAGRG